MKTIYKILIAIVILIIITIIVMSIIKYLKKDTIIDMSKIITDGTYECVVFNGKEIIGSTTLILENGRIINEIRIDKKDNYDDIKYFITLGLIDAHTHVTNEEELNKMINNGIIGAYDVASSKELASSNKNFKMNTAITTIMPGISEGESTVNSLINQEADFIKVMIDMPAIMGGNLIDKNVLQDIVSTAHKNNKKVEAHVTTINAVELAVDVGVDILIHVPIGEKFPEELAKKIKDKNISVVPTLVMMNAFADSPFYGFDKNDYKDAEETVKLLKSYNIPILVGTDANSSFFTPKIEHGISMYNEMELLEKAGLTPIEILSGASYQTIYAFENKEVNVEFANQTIMLVEGRPDKNIKDTKNIRQIWVNKEPIYTLKISKDDLENIKEIGGNIMDNEELIFIPEHPSSIKTHEIETEDSILLEQTEPIKSDVLYNNFINDFDNSLNTYKDKRFEVTGTAIKVGPDIHNKPSVEISSNVEERCHILCVFPNENIYNKVSIGDKVTVKGNYLVMSNWYGIVLKKCELEEK